MPLPDKIEAHLCIPMCRLDERTNFFCSLYFGGVAAVEERITDLFYRGYTAKEILHFLADDGVRISYSHLRSRVMPRLGLVKRGNRPRPVEVAEAVLVGFACCDNLVFGVCYLI